MSYRSFDLLFILKTLMVISTILIFSNFAEDSLSQSVITVVTILCSSFRKKPSTHIYHQVQMQVEAHYVSDILRGNDITEMRITLLRYIDDEMPPDDE